MIRRKRSDRNQIGAVDVHCHILPGLDDGAEDLAETLAMLQIAADEGIRDMIVTPHFNSSGRSASPKTVLHTLAVVQDAAAQHQIPIRLYPGNEIYYFDDLPRFLKERRLLTINKGRHVLIEFSPSVLFRSIQNAMDEVMSIGYIPILAHVERYNILREEIDSVGFLHDIGVEIQVNASSVVGKNGTSVKRFIHQLLEEGVVDYIGTDAHGSRHRAPEIAKCRTILEKNYGLEYAELLMRDNAKKLLGSHQNQTIERY